MATLKEFCESHGGKPGKMINISKDNTFGFVSLQTMDGQCYLSFAKTQFRAEDLTLDTVKNILKTKDLDVLETDTKEGKPCFVIVEHKDIYEAFDF